MPTLDATEATKLSRAVRAFALRVLVEFDGHYTDDIDLEATLDLGDGSRHYGIVSISEAEDGRLYTYTVRLSYDNDELEEKFIEVHALNDDNPTMSFEFRD